MKHGFFLMALGTLVCNCMYAQEVVRDLENALQSHDSQISQDLFALLMIRFDNENNSSWQQNDCLDGLELNKSPKLEFKIKPIRPPQFNKLSEMADYACSQSNVEEPMAIATSLEFLIEPTPVSKPECVNKPDEDGKIFLVTNKPLSIDKPELGNIQLESGLSPEEVVKKYGDAHAAYQQKLKAYEKYQNDLQEFAQFCAHQEALNRYHKYQKQEAIYQDFCSKKLAYESSLENLKQCQNYADKIHVFQAAQLQKETYDKIQATRGVVDINKFDIKALEDTQSWLKKLHEKYERDARSYVDFAEQKKRYDRYAMLSKKDVLIRAMFYRISDFSSQIEREDKDDYGRYRFHKGKMDAQELKDYWNPRSLIVEKQSYGMLKLSMRFDTWDGHTGSFSFYLSPGQHQ